MSAPTTETKPVATDSEEPSREEMLAKLDELTTQLGDLQSSSARLEQKISTNLKENAKTVKSATEFAEIAKDYEKKLEGGF